MELPPRRVVTLVLCCEDGGVLGALPPFEVEVPWWQEAGPIVRGARTRFGVDITVLRLLAAEGEPPGGGPITYLAEVEAAPAVALAPWDGIVHEDEPLR